MKCFKLRAISRQQLRLYLLLASVVLTVAFMGMCLLSSWFSLQDLIQQLGKPVSQLQVVQVKEFEAPAILLLANGIYTYECITGVFRDDPKIRDEDFPNYDREDPRSRIQEDCQEVFMKFAVTLGDLGAQSEILNDLPDWLKKNIITTVDVSSCEGLSAERNNRDAADDLSRCDGQCSQVWECANDPLPCKTSQILERCLNPQLPNHLLDPCPDFQECLSFPVVLTETCYDYVWCMQPENFNEVACQNVVSCVRNGTRSEVCYDIFQCMEDQVQPKCQMFTTEGYSLSQDQLQQSCSTYDDVLQQEPSLAQLKSAPLSLVVIKAPTRFDQKNFVMFSVRSTGNDEGVFSAVHPSYNQLIASHASNGSAVDLYFLRDIVTQLRWNMQTRNLRSFNIMTTKVMKENGVTTEIEIRVESTMSRLNDTNPVTRDYRPVEIFYQWKDDYMIVSDKFLAVTVFDVFGIVASILLMLERAYLTWKRVLQSVVTAKSKIYLRRYELGSREYMLVKSILNQCTNLFTIMMAIRRMNTIAKKLDRLECKRKIEREKDKLKMEQLIKKAKKALALKRGFIDDDLIEWNMKRTLEWKAYKALLHDAIRYRDYREKELEKLERMRLKRLEEIIEIQTESYKRNPLSSAGSSRTSHDLTDHEQESLSGIQFDSEVQARPTNHKEFQKILRNKRTKRLNFQFKPPERDSEDEAPAVNILSGPWRAKRRFQHPLNPQESHTSVQKPTEWLENAFSQRNLTFH